jgi:predicted Zn-ribbon and HTH transcriptional regulator
MIPEEQNEESNQSLNAVTAEVETSVNKSTQIVVGASQATQEGETGEQVAPTEQQYHPPVCHRCGKVGHPANNCANPVVCPRCHKEGHVARVCSTKMPWEFISPFCGLSAYGQGFHVIESTNADEGIKDMSTTALITITAGQANARDIENEFRLKAGPNSTWRWYAKRVGEGRYQMRFPNAQTIDDLAHFTEMRMRSLPEVVIKLEK